MLELRNVYYEVFDENTQTNKEILADVNLTVSDHTFMILTGPNGGGKSTIAKIMMGIEKPTKGKLIWDGEDITQLSITERTRRGIGFAFQQPVRFKGLFVLDLLRFAAGQELTVEEACRYLSEVGLCARDYVGREVNASLSGGELKRIEIAMLIARKTKLSIFDEPEAGIDLWSFRNLVEVFERQQREVSGSIVIISHQERLMQIADTIAVIADGSVTQIGSREELLPKLLADSTTCKYFRQKELIR